MVKKKRIIIMENRTWTLSFISPSQPSIAPDKAAYLRNFVDLKMQLN